MTRPTPQLATGWTAGTPRIYTSKRAAYYAIAKKLVTEKYPPQLHRPEPEVAGWTDEKVFARSERALALFFTYRETYHGPDADPGDFSDLDGWSFDEKKWKRFVSRVAKFLMFVDGKRAEAGLPPDAALDKAHQLAERNAVEWMQEAAKLKAAIDARAAAQEAA